MCGIVREHVREGLRVSVSSVFFCGRAHLDRDENRADSRQIDGAIV